MCSLHIYHLMVFPVTFILCSYSSFFYCSDHRVCHVVTGAITLYTSARVSPLGFSVTLTDSWNGWVTSLFSIALFCTACFSFRRRKFLNCLHCWESPKRFLLFFFFSFGLSFSLPFYYSFFYFSLFLFFVASTWSVFKLYNWFSYNLLVLHECDIRSLSCSIIVHICFHVTLIHCFHQLVLLCSLLWSRMLYIFIEYSCVLLL